MIEPPNEMLSRANRRDWPLDWATIMADTLAFIVEADQLRKENADLKSRFGALTAQLQAALKVVEAARGAMFAVRHTPECVRDKCSFPELDEALAEFDAVQGGGE